MYSDRWSPGLRQGDIFGEAPFPLLKGKMVWGYSGGFASTGSQAPVHVNLPTPKRWLIVVSHDCEFNEGKRTHFVVARLDSINPKTSAEDLERIKLGNDYARAVEEKIEVPLDTFYVEPIPDVFAAPMRANFACLASLPIEWADEALSLKRAEFTHDVRVLFRRKVGVFFGRDAADIDDVEKHDRPSATA